jgi:hypothetical protein
LTLTESTSAEVLQLIREDKITRALFAPAQREAILLVNQQFETSFVTSEYFRLLQAELSAVSARISFLYEPTTECSDECDAGLQELEAISDTEESGGGTQEKSPSRLSTLWK